jgi:hypothetical protein
MQKYKVWLLILFGLGVLIPVLFFTPVAAVRDNSGQYSKKTKHPTAYIRKTDTPTPESTQTSTPKSTQTSTQVDTLDPYEAKLQLTFDAIETMDALVQAEKKKNPNMYAVAQAQKNRTPNGFCEKPMMVIPVGLVVLALFKRRSNNIYL